jgi:Tol biopolymer transport system component
MPLAGTAGSGYSDQREDGMSQEKRLESWKEIEAYLKRDVRTLRRWEREEALPIHRHVHKSRGSVYAYASEIDAWRASRKVVPEPAPARPLWKIPAFALTLLLCLIMVGNGVRPVAAQGPISARQVWARALGDGMDSLSPDGHYITFADWDTGNLATYDLITGTIHRLTANSQPSVSWAERSFVSPDGTQVAYTWWAGEKPYHYEIRLLRLNSTGSSEPRVLLDAREAAEIAPFGWSPDGTKLYVEQTLADRTTQLAVLSLQSGALSTLKSLGWLAVQAKLSPDGRYIVYDQPTGDGAPSSDIAVLAADGSRETVIVHHPAKDFSPMWSPDGSHVLFLSDRTGGTSLWSVPVTDGKSAGEPQLVRADVGPMLPLDLTRDGTLYYQLKTGRRNIHLAEINENGKLEKSPVPLAERFLNSNFHPSWSPNGKFLAYYSMREGAYQRWLGVLAIEENTVLVVRSTATGEEHDIRLPLQVPAYGINAGPRWFPDGKSVVVVGWVSARPGFAYFRVDLESGKTELLHRPQVPLNKLNDGGMMDLSPDGRSIYYLSGGLRRFDMDTGKDQEVRTMSMRDFALAPDGKRIAYARGGAVYVASLADGAPRMLFRSDDKTRAATENTLAWTPDQQYLLFAQSEVAGQPSSPQALWRVPITGGEPQKLGITVRGEFLTPRLHPDGRRLAYETIEAGSDEIWALENFLPKSVGAK